MIIFSPGQHCLYEHCSHCTRDEERDHQPRIPAGVQPRTMLGKQEEIVDHRSQLQEIIDAPTNHETAEDGSSEHEKPLLYPQ